MHIAAVMIASLVPLACGPARAQSVLNLANGGSFAFDGLTFTVEGCDGGSNDCSNAEMIAMGSTGGGVEIEFLGNGGANGTNLLSVANSNALEYFWFTLTVAATGGTNVASLGGAVAGSGGYNNTAFTSSAASCVVSGGWYTGNDCSAYAYVGAPTVTSFSPVSSLSIQYTLGLQGVFGQTQTLSNATTVFASIPEVGSITLILTGLVGMILVRLWPRTGREP